LALILAATHLGRNSRDGSADIGVNALTPQTYAAGALLANGARLEEVYTDFVVLERDSHRERLYLNGHAPANAAQPLWPQMFFVSGSMAAEAAVANSRDPLTDAIRVSPVYQEDRFLGIEVYEGDQQAVLAQIGLEPGDRIAAINGRELHDAGSAIAELRKLLVGQVLTVTVHRSGVIVSLELNGSVLTAAATKG
jgi:type II secretion system protein C